LQSRAPLLLASSSPRRLALLRQVGVIPDRIVAPEVDETPLARELPRAHVLRLAEAKASDIARRPEAAGAFVLAADTVVACGRRILGKADDEAAAERCLRRLSGRRHRVYTAVAAVAPDGRRAVRVAQTLVRFKRLHERDIASYLAAGEWRGKAGGYAIQGRAEAFIPAINGSYSNVVGLPLATTLDLLGGLGWRSEP
jgi:septum formation protein